jgi:hypothetical protein
MNRHKWLLLAVTGLSLALIGCGKKSPVNTSKLQSSFRSAPPGIQSEVDEAVSAINGGNYSEAVADLQRLVSGTKLTPEQEQAVKETIAAIQKVARGTGNKAEGGLQKSLPK